MPAFCAAIIWLMSKPPAPLSALRSKPPCSSSSSSSTYLLQSTCTFVFSSTLSCSRRGQNSSSLSFLTMWKCRLRSALAHTLCLSSTSTSLKNSSSTSYFLPLLVERQRLVGELDLLVLDVRQVHRDVDRVLALRPLDWRPQSLAVRHVSRRLLYWSMDLEMDMIRPPSRMSIRPVGGRFFPTHIAARAEVEPETTIMWSTLAMNTGINTGMRGCCSANNEASVTPSREDLS